MANNTELKNAIAQVIKANGNQEITGQVLQNALNSIISSIGSNATFAGIAIPTTSPGTPDQNVFYFAVQAGTYVNFGGLEIKGGFNIIKNNTSGNWVLSNVYELVQTTGTSTTEVMSQDAVSKEFASVRSDLNETTDKLTELSSEVHGVIIEEIFDSEYQWGKAFDTYPIGTPIKNIGDIEVDVFNQRYGTVSTRLSPGELIVITHEVGCIRSIKSIGVAMIQIGDNLDMSIKDLQSIVEGITPVDYIDNLKTELDENSILSIGHDVFKLTGEVVKGRFDADYYSRINIIPGRIDLSNGKTYAVNDQAVTGHYLSAPLKIVCKTDFKVRLVVKYTVDVYGNIAFNSYTNTINKESYELLDSSYLYRIVFAHYNSEVIDNEYDFTLSGTDIVKSLSGKFDVNNENITSNILNVVGSFATKRMDFEPSFFYTQIQGLVTGNKYKMVIDLRDNVSNLVIAMSSAQNGASRLTPPIVGTYQDGGFVGVEMKKGIYVFPFTMLASGQYIAVHNNSSYDICRICVYDDIEDIVSKNGMNRYNSRSNIFGVEIDYLNNASVSRIADSVGLNADYMIGSNFSNGGSNDFDELFPWCEMKLCNVNASNGIKTIVYEGESGFARDGSNGEVMVEIPKFYTMRQFKNNGTKEIICISGEKKSGFELEPAFVDSNTGEEINFIYVGAYLTSLIDGCHTSRTGLWPSDDKSLLQFREAGEMYDFVTLQAIQKLFVVEFATVNTSKLFGGLSYLIFTGDVIAYESVPNTNTAVFYSAKNYMDSIKNLFVGCTISVADSLYDVQHRRVTGLGEVISWEDNGKTRNRRSVTFDGEPVNVVENQTYLYCSAQINGLSDSIEYHTGRAGLTETTLADQFKYRNIEGLWGNIGNMIDGIRLKQLYYYFHNIKSEYNDLLKYKKLGFMAPRHDYGNYNHTIAIIKGMGLDRRFPTVNLPSQVTSDGSGSDTTYYADLICAEGSTNDEYIGISSMAWDGNERNGLFMYRFWHREDYAAWLYGTRMIYRNV